jgi:hypothetical protein
LTSSGRRRSGADYGSLGEHLGGVVWRRTAKELLQQTEVTASIIKQTMRGHKYALQIGLDLPESSATSGRSFEEAQTWGESRKTQRPSQCFRSDHRDANSGYLIITNGTKALSSVVVRSLVSDVN